MDVALERPVIADSSLRAVNFFNGRLLSAEDLSREQATNREGHRQLGRAIGEGVAYGLEVALDPSGTAAAPIVAIQPGLALNRRGRALVLPEAVRLSLVPPSDPNTATPASGFKDCLPPQSGVYIVGEGVYLLAIGPAESTEGRAPVSGVNTNAGAACNTRYRVEAVEFRLIPLNDALQTELSQLAAAINQARSNPTLLSAERNKQRDLLRNRVAHRCLGTGEAAAHALDPFGSAMGSYGLLDSLRPASLTECEVPLAVIYWTPSGVQFADAWSVRRRLAQPVAASDWPTTVGERRLGEGEAAFLQFQDQMDAIRFEFGLIAQPRLSRPTLATSLSALLPTTPVLPSSLAPVVLPTGFRPRTISIRADERFRYLPAAGYLPIVGPNSPSGFDFRRFFEGQPYREPSFIPAARVDALMRASFAYPPIDLQRGELIWLYQVTESVNPAASRLGSPAQRFLIFTTGHMPFQAEPRLNVARCELGHFA